MIVDVVAMHIAKDSVPVYTVERPGFNSAIDKNLIAIHSSETPAPLLKKT